MVSVTRCRTLLFVLTPGILYSEWCLKELQAAVDAKLNIVFVRLQSLSKQECETMLVSPPSSVPPSLLSTLREYSSSSLEYNPYFAFLLPLAAAAWGHCTGCRRGERARDHGERQSEDACSRPPSRRFISATGSTIPSKRSAGLRRPEVALLQ
jgi:hypothetical protein